MFITVHLEAKKEGLKGLTKEELPRLKPLLKQSYLLFPLLLLIYLVGTSTRSIAYAAAIAIVAAVVRFALTEKVFSLFPENFPAGAFLSGNPAIGLFQQGICIKKRDLPEFGKSLSLRGFPAVLHTPDHNMTGDHFYISESGRTIWVPMPLSVKISNRRV